jgi:hypothetical protein
MSTATQQQSQSCFDLDFTIPDAADLLSAPSNFGPHKNQADAAAAEAAEAGEEGSRLTARRPVCFRPLLRLAVGVIP